ncbi:MAG TPA: response regulator [Thermoanaerobaculaceae bacterium]|nr:response regulator [Thermoanaerobaculaceae bacterium]
MALKRVLVADDSRIFRSLLVEVLRDRGLEVIEAANGREALDALLAQRPELAVLDALMPLLSGFDVISTLHEKAPDYQPVIFLVTAVYKSRRWETEARQHYKVHEYLEKPLEPAELLEKITRHFPEFEATVAKPGPSSTPS